MASGVVAADSNLAKNDGCTPSWIAASQGSIECLKALMEAGADVDKEDKSQGATPLFVASQNGRKVYLREFLRI